MPLAGRGTLVPVIWEPTIIIITFFSLISMIMVISFCTCCKKISKYRDTDDAYGMNSAAVTVTSGEGPSTHTVQFRSLTRIGKINERHSQPTSKNGSNILGGATSRASAPLQTGRALPQLPGDLYSAVDKSRKDGTAFADEGGNPMYESIDPENDSFIDPLYSKVGDPLTSRRERKYDYPVFPGRKKIDGLRTSQEEVLYQSASQVYTIGSEDPYSSITSEPRQIVDCGGDEDSVYDPGYAKVTPKKTDARRQDRLEKAELELDHLYSRIRRSSSRESNKNLPGPSRVTIDDIIGEDLDENMEPMVTTVLDNHSSSSREPSYRYITVRENAEVVRERLRQQGQLGPPAREHYYSTIGNEYETVGDGASSTYSAVPPAANFQAQAVSDVNDLSVSTTVIREFVPPPPTSPIPEWTPTSNNHRNLNNDHANIPPLDQMSTYCASSNATPFLSKNVLTPIYQQNNVQPQSLNDSIERVKEPISGATYTVVSKIHKETSIPCDYKSKNPINGSSIYQSTADSSSRIGDSCKSEYTRLSSCIDWNAPSRQTATSFAGLNRIEASMQECTLRPVLPYNTEAVIGRKVTEERETVVENIKSLSNEPVSFRSLDPGDLKRIFLNQNCEETGICFHPEKPSEKVFNVDIKRIEDVSISLGGRGLNGTRYHRSMPVSTSLSEPCALFGGTTSNSTVQLREPGPDPLPSAIIRSEINALSSSINNVCTEDRLSASPYSFGSRSGLPVVMNGEKTRKTPEISKQRRQTGLESEDSERRKSQTSKRRLRGIHAISHKGETEEEKRLRLGTIFTANDYVSTIDMSEERPWPIAGTFSPVLKNGKAGQEEELDSNLNKVINMEE